MPIAIIPRDNSARTEQLALMQVLGQTANQGVQNYLGYQDRQKADAERQALAQLLGGAPATPGSLGAGTGFAGSPELGGQTNAGDPGAAGLLPGVSPAEAQAWVAAGLGPQAAQVGLQRRFPEPMSPVDQARLYLQRQGLEIDKQGMQLRREMFASDQEFQRAKLALDERKLVQDASATGQAKLSDLGSFRGQFTGLSEDFIATRDAYGKLRAAVQDPSAAGDVALISGYMKMIDPTSVVREGEYATAANAAGIPEQIRGYWNRLVNGERLTADQRTDFARQGHNLFAAQLQQQEQLQAAYRGIAQRTIPGYDPADVVPDFVGTAREWQPIVGEPSAAALASTPGQVVERGRQAVEGMLPPGATIDEVLDFYAR